MDVTLSGRMGGPEVGTTYLPALVATRPALKRALADATVDGVGLVAAVLDWLVRGLEVAATPRSARALPLSAVTVALRALQAASRGG